MHTVYSVYTVHIYIYIYIYTIYRVHLQLYDYTTYNGVFISVGYVSNIESNI